MNTINIITRALLVLDYIADALQYVRHFLIVVANWPRQKLRELLRKEYNTAIADAEVAYRELVDSDAAGRQEIIDEHNALMATFAEQSDEVLRRLRAYDAPAAKAARDNERKASRAQCDELICRAAEV